MGDFRYLAAKFIQLRKQNKKIEVFSYKSLELEASIPEDASLANQFCRVGVVEEANPAPDKYGNTCPLEKGDIVYGDILMYSHVWQEERKIGNDVQKHVILKNNLVAYEHNGKVYGYPKCVNKDNGDHVYRPGFELTIHRSDLHEKWLTGEMFSNLYRINDWDQPRNDYSVYEVISEGENKGKYLVCNLPVPVMVDHADFKRKGIETVLPPNNYWAVELDYVIFELITEVEHESE